MPASATLAGSGSFADQQRQIAEVASRLFGTTVKPERIIGETLRRVTTEIDFTTTAAREQLRGAVESAVDNPPAHFDAFKQTPSPAGSKPHLACRRNSKPVV